MNFKTFFIAKIKVSCVDQKRNLHKIFIKKTKISILSLKKWLEKLPSLNLSCLVC